MSALRIATRGSDLALWQARHVQQRLQQTAPDTSVEILVVKTKGDEITDVPLAKVGGKGLFVKEIEDALLSKRASTFPTRTVSRPNISLKPMAVTIPFRE